MPEVPAPSPYSFWDVYRLPIIFGGLSLFFLVIAFILLLKSTQTTEPIRFSNESQGSTSGSFHRTVTVDIAGAVKNPGVYTLEEGKRIEDAIISAGGLSPDADSDKVSASINRAAILLDGAKLYISKKGDTQVLGISGGNAVNHTSININTASEKELDTLSGIGEVTAKKIIAGRPYQTLEELMSRKIISQSVFEKIKGELTL